MNPQNASNFLGTVRAALGYRSDACRTAPPDLFPDGPSDRSRRLLEHIRGRSRNARRALIKSLQKTAEPIHLRVYPAATIAAARDIIVDAVSHNSPEWGERKQVCAWSHPLIERLEIAAALRGDGVVVVTPPAGNDMAPDARSAFTQGVRDSFIGITSADYCVADTATLVLRTRPGQPRSVSLVPSIHVAVIHENQILADLKELYAVLRWGDDHGADDLTSCLTFISGPSKTADIEATLVHGAHGPRELYLIVLQA